MGHASLKTLHLVTVKPEGSHHGSEAGDRPAAPQLDRSYLVVYQAPTMCQGYCVSICNSRNTLLSRHFDLLQMCEWRLREAS